jgi:hypothetical protein
MMSAWKLWTLAPAAQDSKQVSKQKVFSFTPLGSRLQRIIKNQALMSS